MSEVKRWMIGPMVGGRDIAGKILPPACELDPPFLDAQTRVREDRATETDRKAVENFLYGKLRMSSRSLSDDAQELLSLVFREGASRG